MLYIHIPFCKQACHYCDFHFSTNMALRQKMVDAICKEISIRKNYLSNNILSSIYFGGGTPSLLTEADFAKIFESINANFSIEINAEITVEANPDDLSIEKFQFLKNLGVNRLSIGIQSFNDSHLAFMNRAHTQSESIKCIENAKNIGFDNFSIDIIYGIPAPDHSLLINDIELATSFDVDHISAYCLTIEPKTAFGRWVKNKKMNPIEEDFAAEQFEITMNLLAKKGYEQYEISNFARNKNYSKHNTNYWLGQHYLGVGPAAHSFNGLARQANISNNKLYINALDIDSLDFVEEELTLANRTNEYILTGLRTIWGVDLARVETISEGNFSSQNEFIIDNFLEKKTIEIKNNALVLTEKGKLFADEIAANLFVEI